MAFYEIPLSPRPQRMTLNLGGSIYQLRFGFANEAEGGWFMDIADSLGNPMVTGIPLVTGADLLAQYRYLGIPGRLWVTTDGAPNAVPTYANLGSAGHLFFEPF
jgi:hypothetical protein